MTRPAGLSRPSDLLGRLFACLAGALVLSLMWGPQEGSFGNFYFAIKKGLFTPRVFVFLALGVLVFLAITFWPKVVPFLTRPGVWPLAAGALTVIASQTLMHWADQVGDAKFGTVAEAVANTNGISPLASAFFGGLAWAQLVVIVLLIGAAIVTGLRNFGWAAAVLSVVAAVIAYLSHAAVVDRGRRRGPLAGRLRLHRRLPGAHDVRPGDRDVACSRWPTAGRAVNRVLGWRPGLPLVVIGAVLGLISHEHLGLVLTGELQRHPRRHQQPVQQRRPGSDRVGVPALAGVGAVRDQPGAQRSGQLPADPAAGLGRRRGGRRWAWRSPS